MNYSLLDARSSFASTSVRFKLEAHLPPFIGGKHIDELGCTDSLVINDELDFTIPIFVFIYGNSGTPQRT
ncbi:hypothetical protein [uncultured Sphaerochaeta sp.]|uniref:hypothetical protein n=1 Tax=uncultured Sphaerochaeta sp. TaxID=886478 RepID=UPI0029C9FA61|nr:hypothetical protein [uncultured Sphaerochaeta sp.]